jgi:hypothetical protein
VVRPELEVADIFRGHGPAWRQANAGHVSLGQLKVMSAIENCRTAALGGHVLRCESEKCGYTRIAFNSCRNRHCPKCQGAAAKEWLAEREAELLPVTLCSVAIYVLASSGCAVGGPRARFEDHITDHYKDLKKLISPGSSRQCLVRLGSLTSQQATALAFISKSTSA